MRTPAEQPRPHLYQQAAARIGGNRACLAVARKLLKRSYHTLRELGNEGLAPLLERSFVRAQAPTSPMRRGQLPACCCRHVRVDGLKRPSGRNAFTSGNYPITIMSPARRTAGPRTEISMGARAYRTNRSNPATAPPQGGPIGPRAP